MSKIIITTDSNDLVSDLLDVVRGYPDVSFTVVNEAGAAAELPRVTTIPFLAGDTVTLLGDKFRITTTVKSVNPDATDGKVIKLRGGAGQKLVDGRWVEYTLKTISLTQADLDAGKLHMGTLTFPSEAPVDPFAGYVVGGRVFWAGEKFALTGTIKKFQDGKMFITPTPGASNMRKINGQWVPAPDLKTVSIVSADLATGNLVKLS